MKLKDYIKLHRQMTNLSTTAIWEALKDGKPVSEILTDVPDEFFERVRLVENNLKNKFNFIDRYVRQDFWYIKTIIEKQNNRKNFAELVFNDPAHKQMSHILFSMFDGKDYSQQIWKLIKPKYEKI